MALLAEEIVEEWLNRRGYFTIRGARAGVHEIDLLAVLPTTNELQCRHIEVQASSNPIAYIAPTTRDARARGAKANSAKRRETFYLRACVDEWLERKFFATKKQKIRESLAAGPWAVELVVHLIKYPEELEYIESCGVRVHRLAQIIDELVGTENLIASAAGSALVDLVRLRPHDRLT